MGVGFSEKFVGFLSVFFVGDLPFYENRYKQCRPIYKIFRLYQGTFFLVNFCKISEIFVSDFFLIQWKVTRLQKKIKNENFTFLQTPTFFFLAFFFHTFFLKKNFSKFFFILFFFFGLPSFFFVLPFLHRSYKFMPGQFSTNQRSKSPGVFAMHFQLLVPSRQKVKILLGFWKTRVHATKVFFWGTRPKWPRPLNPPFFWSARPAARKKGGTRSAAARQHRWGGERSEASGHRMPLADGPVSAAPLLRLLAAIRRSAMLPSIPGERITARYSIATPLRGCNRVP